MLVIASSCLEQQQQRNSIAFPIKTMLYGGLLPDFCHPSLILPFGYMIPLMGYM